MIKIVIDEPMPDFDLPSVNYRGVQTQLSAEMLADRPYLFYVYPKDSTPGCTLEAEGFSEIFLELRELGVEVYGLSRDSIKTHEKFIKKYELPYSLISDEKQSTLNRWGLIYDSKMYGKPVTKVSRVTAFVVEGKVVQFWDRVVPSEHAAEVLAWLEEWAKTR